MRTYRITYKDMKGEIAYYYVAEVNTYFAILAFKLRTCNPNESVLSVEVKIGRSWWPVQ